MIRPRLPNNRPKLPAKLDVGDPRDRAWIENNHAIIIKLDGKPQNRVLKYDTEAGTLTKHKEDASGKVVIDKLRGIAEVENLTGTIAVEWA